MSKIVCITGRFPKYDRYGFPTGETELLVSHGIEVESGKNVVLPCEHPHILGAVFDSSIQEYVLNDGV